MNELTIPEKINNIIKDMFDELNVCKRSYVIQGGYTDGELKNEYELKMIKSILQLELSVRKIQSLNNASLHSEKSDLVLDKKNTFFATDNNSKFKTS